MCKKEVGGRGKFDLLVAIHATAVVAEKAVEAESFVFVFVFLYFFDLLVAIHATAVVAQKAVEAASFEFNVFVLLLLVFFIFSFDVNQNCKDCTCLVGSGG